MRTLKERPYALIFPEGEGRTEQALASETDINTIMAKAMRGDHIDFAQKHEPRYGDATGPDFVQAQLIVANANTMFEELPSKIRSKFDHNPAQFLEFVQNPENEDELIKLKLIKDKRQSSPLKNQKPPNPTPEQVDKAPEKLKETAQKTEPKAK